LAQGQVLGFLNNMRRPAQVLQACQVKVLLPPAHGPLPDERSVSTYREGFRRANAAGRKPFSGSSLTEITRVHAAACGQLAPAGFFSLPPLQATLSTGLFGDPVFFEHFLAPLTQDRTLTTWMVTGMSLVYLSG
jgi:hypothetical protein